MGNRKSDLNGGPLWLSSFLLPSFKEEEAGKIFLGGCELFLSVLLFSVVLHSHSYTENLSCSWSLVKNCWVVFYARELE